METVITPAFELTYNGKNITSDITPFVIGVRYTDNLSGEADSIDIDLEDTDGRWADSWYPEKGTTLAYKYGYRNQPLVSAGSFDLDEIELSGPAMTARIRAISAGVQKNVRTSHGRGYEKTTLEAIAKRIAKRNRMTLVGKIARIPIDRATQYKESDIAFLTRLAAQYGYIFKVTENNTKLVIWQTSDMIGQSAIRRYSPKDVASWRIRDKISDVPASVRVRSHHRRKRRLISARAKTSSVTGKTASGKNNSSDVVELTRRAPTKASAELIAQAELDRRHMDRTAAEIELEGDPAITAGVSIELSGFGQLSGLYLVWRTTHTHQRTSGYQMRLELKRTKQSEKKTS